MYLLLVEDDDPKRDKIRNFVISMLPNAKLGEARSVRSAIDLLRKREPDLVLLDMSLPTFDISEHEPGGRPQGFGGKEVLRYLGRFGLQCPAIVVTGYEAFMNEMRESVGLKEMDDELREKFPANYRGLVYYNSLYSDWVKELQERILGVIPQS